MGHALGEVDQAHEEAPIALERRSVGLDAHLPTTVQANDDVLHVEGMALGQERRDEPQEPRARRAQDVVDHDPRAGAEEPPKLCVRVCNPAVPIEDDLRNRRSVEGFVEHSRIFTLPQVRCGGGVARPSRSPELPWEGARSPALIASFGCKAPGSGGIEVVMPTLSDMLGGSPKRQQVLDDACRVLDEEVADKGGLSGLAIKGAYGLVKGIKPGFVREVVDSLLDDFLRCLDPLYQEAVAKGIRPGSHIQANSDRVADALLAVTDGKAARAQRAIIKSTYEKLRPTAKKQVQAAAPRLGALLERHPGFRTRWSEASVIARYLSVIRRIAEKRSLRDILTRLPEA